KANQFAATLHGRQHDCVASRATESRNSWRHRRLKVPRNRSTIRKCRKTLRGSRAVRGSELERANETGQQANRIPAPPRRTAALGQRSVHDAALARKSASDDPPLELVPGRAPEMAARV